MYPTLAVKPSNCMLHAPLADLYSSPLNRVHLKLIDFGFAKCLDGMEASRHGMDASRHGKSRHGNSRHGNSRHSGSRHGGSRHGGSRHGGSRHGNSRHGGYFSAAFFGAGQHDAPTTEGEDVSIALAEPSPALSPDPTGNAPMQRTPNTDVSVHNISPKGSRHFAAPGLSNPASFRGELSEKMGPRADGRLPMTRHEALQLDAYSLGCVLRYMLTGVPPQLSLMEAISAEQQAACFGCIFAACYGSPSPRRIVEPTQLSSAAREVLSTFAAKPEVRYTVADARALKWLQDDSIHGLLGSNIQWQQN